VNGLKIATGRVHLLKLMAVAGVSSKIQTLWSISRENNNNNDINNKVHDLLIEELVCSLGAAHLCPRANIKYSNLGNGGEEGQKQMD